MALLTCSHARDLVTRQALGLDALAEHLRAARAHIATCAACRDYLVRFGRAILSGADELTCAEVRARLDASVGIKDEHMMVHDHLARCPACALEADVWESISVLQAQGALAEPPRYPVFDLSFLPQPLEVWTQVRSGVRRLAYEIPAALVMAGKALLSPLPGLAVSYATVQSARRATGRKGKDNLVSLSVDDSEQGMRIALDVSEAEKARWVAVTLRTLPADRPLGGARVALCNEQGQAQEIKTVRSGEAEARFSDIAPGHYIVRVQHSGKTWELPVNL